MKNEGRHVFEVSGCGVAPFRLAGMFSLPSPSLAEHNPTAYNNGMAMIPRGLHAGSCRHCGTAIMHHFIVEDAQGGRFVVGSDCVAKTGDAGLIKAVRAERLKVVREKREASKRVARAEREAFWAAERKSKAELFAHEHAALVQRAAPYMADGGFIADVITKALEGRYSDRSIEAVTKVIDDLERRAFRKANSKHVGVVGKRSVWEVEVVRRASFDRPSFGAPWRSETVWIITMVDAEGNALVSKSTSFGWDAQKGDKLKIKATIKAHDAYDGEAQTILQRIAKV